MRPDAFLSGIKRFRDREIRRKQNDGFKNIVKIYRSRSPPSVLALAREAGESAWTSLARQGAGREEATRFRQRGRAPERPDHPGGGVRGWKGPRRTGVGEAGCDAARPPTRAGRETRRAGGREGGAATPVRGAPGCGAGRGRPRAPLRGSRRHFRSREEEEAEAEA